MSNTLPSKRTSSLSGSSRLALSVGKAAPSPGTGIGRHPLKTDWTISYVHRPPGAKNLDYEKEIRKVASFGSIESFLHLYAHLTPPSELPAVTDMLVFESRIRRPGIWEEMREGGRFTLRLLKPITPLLYESLLLSLIGDQFDESDAVVGCVLSVRQTEDILSVWVEEEGEGVRSGLLREKILSLLSLPSSTTCEYRSNKALLDAAISKPPLESDQPNPYPNGSSTHNQNQNQNQNQIPQSATHPIQAQQANSYAYPTQQSGQQGRGYGYRGGRNGVPGGGGGEYGVREEKDGRVERGWGNGNANAIGNGNGGGFRTRE